MAKQAGETEHKVSDKLYWSKEEDDARDRATAWADGWIAGNKDRDIYADTVFRADALKQPVDLNDPNRKGDFCFKGVVYRSAKNQERVVAGKHSNDILDARLRDIAHSGRE